MAGDAATVKQRALESLLMSADPAVVAQLLWELAPTGTACSEQEPRRRRPAAVFSLCACRLFCSRRWSHTEEGAALLPSCAARTAAVNERDARVSAAAVGAAPPRGRRHLPAGRRVAEQQKAMAAVAASSELVEAARLGVRGGSALSAATLAASRGVLSCVMRQAQRLLAVAVRRHVLCAAGRGPACARLADVRRTVGKGGKVQ